ncbi:MAG: alpha/beta fold hydrolase [Geitlerinemataceae cyanobacterium]
MTATTIDHQTPDGQTIHTAIAGTGAPLLCLHGHPGTGACFDPVMEPLRDRYRIVAPDLRGYGQSPTKSPFEMEAHIGDLISLLDRLELDTCTIVGWSLGGIIAMELAIRYPDRVNALALIATAARPRSDHPAISPIALGMTAIAGLTSAIVPAAGFLPAIAQRSLLRYLISQHTPTSYKNIGQYGVAAFQQTTTFAHQALNAAIRQRYDREADLGAIACPSLVVAAADDRHICATASRRTAERLPNCEWIYYENAAHLFPWEMPDRLRADLTSWLDRHGL